MIRRLLLTGLVGVALPFLVATQGAAPRADAVVPEEVVVLLGSSPLAGRTGADRVRAAAAIDTEQRRFADALRRAVPGSRIRWRYRHVLNGVAVLLPAGRSGALLELPGVADVAPPVAYRALEGPDAATIRARLLSGSTLDTAGDGVKIAIVDDGVDQTHAFFDPAGYAMPPGFPKGQRTYTTAKVIVARAFPPPGATWRYAGVPFDPEESSHGTHVAGIAAGNAGTPTGGGRVTGVAPRAYIGNYKALTVPTDANVGLDGNAPELVAAIEAAVADGMDVINLSIGEPEIEPSRDVVALALDAAARAGVVSVVAAGNDRAEFGNGSLSSPGTSAEAITVGAVSASEELAGFSASGPTALSLRLKPDVVAPGTGIVSSVPGGWETLSGTSMAAPHVAGAAALLLQRHPDWSPARVKAALVGTARPALADPGVEAVPTHAGAGIVDVAAADRPLVAASPTSLSFGLLAGGTTLRRDVMLEDTGEGAGDWTVGVELRGAPAGAALTAPPTVTVPGTLSLDAVAGRADGELSGIVVLRRGADARRIPFWARVSTPRLAAPARTLTTAGVYAGNTRGRPALATIYRYPEVPPAGAVTSSLAGPEQVFRVRLARPVANFGVVITSRAPGVRVEPRVVVAGDESRLTGYAALPVNLNPYLVGFGDPVLAAGAIRPAAGAYDVVFDSPTPVSAGAFRFRLWIDDVRPPSATLVARTVARGAPIRLRVTDSGSGVDPASVEATVDGRDVPTRLRSGVLELRVGRLAPGPHRVRVQVSDHQETRNMENVARILPNTRVVTARVVVRAQ